MLGAYRDTVAWLQGLEVSAGWDLKLERMQQALALRGHPERAYPVLHVAGTNGKGSTAAMLEAVLGAAGRRVGLYTSPHLVDFAERVRIGGRTIPHATVVDMVAALRPVLAAAGIALTHFEMVTLLAFEWFARVGVDAAVVEVGLGGRLDATNVVHPAVTAITSIGLDHEPWLGHDLATIAREKAGILKPGVPLALGRVPLDAERVIRARAREVGAPVLAVGEGARLDGPPTGLAFRAAGVDWEELRLGLPGAVQRDNAAVALAALALVHDRFGVSEDAVRRGLAAVRWPGRFAVVREAPRVVLDGAHNPDGAAALARELPALVGRRAVTLVFAAMQDKNWWAMLDALAPHVTRALVTRVGARAADPEEVAATIAPRLPARAIADPRAAVAAALAETPATGAVLVTGSLFLVGEAYATLGVPLFEAWTPPEVGGRQTAL